MFTNACLLRDATIGLDNRHRISSFILLNDVIIVSYVSVGKENIFP